MIGGGVAGTRATRMAAGIGAEVTILDRSMPRLPELDERSKKHALPGFRRSTVIGEEVFSADVVIGAMLVPGASAPKLVSRGMLSSLRKGAVIVDVAEPSYEVDGVVQYCGANMPQNCPAHVKPGPEQRCAAVWLGTREQALCSCPRKFSPAPIGGMLTYRGVTDGLGYHIRRWSRPRSDPTGPP